MSSLRQRTLWRVMLLLLGGSGLLALYNYHDSRHEINGCTMPTAQNARLLQGIMSLPVQGQSRDELYRAFDEALSKAGQDKVGHRYESKLAFGMGRRQRLAGAHAQRPAAGAAAPGAGVCRHGDGWAPLAQFRLAGAGKTLGNLGG